MKQQTITKDFAEKVNEDMFKVWSLSSFYTLEYLMHHTSLLLTALVSLLT